MPLPKHQCGSLAEGTDVTTNIVDNIITAILQVAPRVSYWDSQEAIIVEKRMNGECYEKLQ